MKKQDVYIAWITWSIIFFIAIRNFSLPFITPKAESLLWSDQVLYAIVVFSLLETGITFLLRHFFIMKPFRNGTYNPNTQVARFFMIGILNWIISNTIVFYGTVTYWIYGTMWQHYYFGILGFSLLFFHSPRLGPFKEGGSSFTNTRNVEPEIKKQRLNLFSDFVFATLFILTIVVLFFGDLLMIKLAEMFVLTPRIKEWIRYGIIIMFITATVVRAVQVKNKLIAEKQSGFQTSQLQ